MRLGLHALGIGPGARHEVMTAVAAGAEARGWSSLWVGEHVVMVDRPQSRYPYAGDGAIPVPADADWLDPLVTLGYLAASTERIRLGTGVLLLPEHNPVVVAKQAASIDVLSGGRLVLGVGVGWSKEEFVALGVEFAGRGARTVEYVAAMRTLWAEEVASFSGHTVAFRDIRVNPKPERRRVPVYFGGNSDAALRRVVEVGDGWYGFNLTVEEAAERLARLQRLCEERGRSRDELEVAVAPTGASPADAAELRSLGVDEAVVVTMPPGEVADVEAWLDDLTGAWAPETERPTARRAPGVRG